MSTEQNADNDLAADLGYPTPQPPIEERLPKEDD